MSSWSDCIIKVWIEWGSLTKAKLDIVYVCIHAVILISVEMLHLYFKYIMHLLKGKINFFVAKLLSYVFFILIKRQNYYEKEDEF